MHVFGRLHVQQFGRAPRALRDAAFWGRPRVLRGARARRFIEDNLGDRPFLMIDSRFPRVGFSGEVQQVEYTELEMLLESTPGLVDLAVFPETMEWTGIVSIDGGPWVVLAEDDSSDQP